MDFTGKTVVVTGSSRGIGKAIAERFAQLNANVVINGTNKPFFIPRRSLLGASKDLKAI